MLDHKTNTSAQDQTPGGPGSMNEPLELWLHFWLQTSLRAMELSRIRLFLSLSHTELIRQPSFGVLQTQWIETPTIRLW